MEKFDKVLMKVAEEWANMSYCKRLKVGAVLSKNGRILATGYNGTISGQKNECEKKKICPECEGAKFETNSEQKCFYCGGTGFVEVTSDFVLHAEQNVIAFCAKEGILTNNTVMYITHSPCPHCAKLIAQSGVKEVIYKQEYRNTDGIEFLKKIGVKVRKFSNGD